MTSPMKQCTELEAFLDGRLEETARRHFEHHLSGCDDCKAAAKSWQTVKKVYAGWVEQVTGCEANRLQKPSAREFAASIIVSLEAAEERPRMQPRARRMIYRLAAAAVLLGLAVTVHWMIDREQPVSTPSVGAVPPLHPLEIPAIIITDSKTERVFLEGGAKNHIAAPKDGRILTTVGLDRIGVDASGEIRIAEIRPEQTAVRLLRGRTAFAVSPRAESSRFTVTAGDVIVAVMGTRFSVSMDNDHTVTVCVEEGNVSVFAESWRVQLDAGSSVTVERGVAQPVRGAREDEIQILARLLSANAASTVEQNNDEISEMPSSAVRSMRKPKIYERREQAAQPQKNAAAWRDLIVAGEIQEAEKQIRAFLDRRSNDAESLILLANCQKRRGRFKDAVETYEHVIGTGDDVYTGRARYLAATLSYRELKDPRRAVSLIDDYLKNSPPNTPNRVDAELLQAEALIDLGAEARAERILRSIVEDYGRTPIANRARELLDRLPADVGRQ